MTHNGAGRITRARLVGKTSGSASGENKSTGLAVNVKETKPIDFGEVIVGDGKTVRSTLMINDSSETITIYSIDVIEADNGLQRIDQGCDVDMELPPGASCPVTLLWVPKSNGPVSTDLIIRHSGKLGFAVIPIRGSAKNSKNPEGLADLKDHLLDKDGKKDGIPLPPSQKDLAVLVKLERAITGKVEPLSGASLGHSISEATDSSPAGGDGKLHLIGTVGADRAVLLKPSGETAIVSVAATFDVDEKEGKLLSISARSVDVTIDGKKKTLSLESVKFLVMRATQSTKQDDKDSKGAAGGSNVSGGSTGGGQK